MKPIVFDLYAGLGGWSEAFIADGYRAIGFDIEKHDYGTGGYPGELVLCDVRSLTGAELVKQYGVPSVIVASPPCQAFSYMAMPWSKAKAKRKAILEDKTGKLRTELTELFNQCFRIQREVIAACGHHVPMVVENVRGAQKWVGRSAWNFGSFHLWGDVPALMPIPGVIRKTPVGSWDLTRKNYNPEHRWKNEGNKTSGMNWSDQTKRGQDFTRIAGMQADGIKKQEIGYDYENRTFGWKAPATSSQSLARKRASAEIAKIPPALASWIARVYKPVATS